MLPIQRLSVVIVSWNVQALLRACLESLADEQRRSAVAIDVWVLDNASSDGSPEMVADQYPRVNLVRSPENLGYVQGNNLVLRRILETDPPEAIWLLNPDTVVCSGCTATMLDFLAAKPQAGLIGPKLLNLDGSLQESAFHFPGFLQLLFEFRMLPQRLYYSRLNGRYSATAYGGSTPFPVDHPLGAAMMARSAAVMETGLLDDGFFMYCEEIDWAWRMQKLGWTSWLVPKAEVIHHGGASTGQVRPTSLTRLWVSRARLYRKHRSAWAVRLASSLVRRAFRITRETPDELREAYLHIVEAWSA